MKNPSFGQHDLDSVMTQGPSRSEPTLAAAERTLLEIQILRGIAALLVVFHHYIGTAVERGFAILGLEGITFGNVGVDIFFVISGFIMEYVSGSKSYVPGGRKAFMLNRVYRILPLYWILTIVAFAVSLILPGVNSSATMQQFLMSMLLLPDSNEAAGGYIISMAWTLSYEFYFYVVFALFLATTPRLRFIGMAGFFSLMVALGTLMPSSGSYLGILTNPLLFEFLAGCVLAHLYRSGIRLSSLSRIAMAALAAILLLSVAKTSINDSWTRLLLWGFPAALVVYAAVLGPSFFETVKNSKFTQVFRHIGDISYSLYLSHFFVLAIFVRLYDILDRKISIDPWIACGAIFLLCLLVAQVCYMLIENPTRILLKGDRLKTTLRTRIAAS